MRNFSDAGSFGVPAGTTQVVAAAFGCAYPDVTQSCRLFDVISASLPPQPAGTTVRYVVGAWHTGGNVTRLALPRQAVGR